MIDFTMPSLGADMQSAKIVEWFVEPGKSVKKGDIIADVETEKGVIEIESWHTGVISEICADIGEVVNVGGLLARIETDNENVPETLSTPPASRDESEKVVIAPSVANNEKASNILSIPHDDSLSVSERIKISPLARKLAGDYEINLANIQGSGYGGAIRRDDILRHLKSINEDDFKKDSKNVPGDSRHVISQLMSRSHNEIPHYYLSTRVAVGKSLGILNQLNESRSPSEQVLIAGVFLKAIAMACREFKDFNGHWQDDTFQASNSVNIGLSIHSRSYGLVAPCIFEADKKNIFEISSQVLDLVSRLRGGKLRRDEMVAGSITCTYLGERGVDEVFGLINPPQVTLVGIGHVFQSPAAFQDKIGIESFIMLSLSGDHRAHDGHRGSLFLRKIKDAIEQASHLEDLDA